MRHSILIPTMNNKPCPVGYPLTSNPNYPSSVSPIYCEYSCTLHGETIRLLWNGENFSLPKNIASAITLEDIDFIYE